MELAYLVLFLVGFVLLVIYAIDKHIVLDALRKDLEDYVKDCQEVVRIADEPRVKIHYKAVVTVLSGILSKYFPEI